MLGSTGGWVACGLQDLLRGTLLKDRNLDAMSSLAMPDERRDDSRQREMALARWDNEGGAGSHHKGARAVKSGKVLHASPRQASAELVQLRIRVIALENLVITLLAGGSEQQFTLARAMAAHVAPRLGFTHRMTSHAATQMLHLIRRAEFFRTTAPSDPNLD